MRFNGLKSHLRLQKLRFLDAPGLFLLEIVLTGAYDLADVLANVLVLKWMIGALMGRDLIRAAWVLGGFLVYQLSVSFLWHWYFERVYPQWKERLEYKLNRSCTGSCWTQIAENITTKRIFMDTVGRCSLRRRRWRKRWNFTGSCSAVFWLVR